jgi:GT2 family glycosyltransferase
MMPNPPLVTVSVVSHDDWGPLQALLESLRTYEKPELVQLIVTDNMGRDLPALQARPWNSVLVLRNPVPQGYAHNHNTAFKQATGQYFCIVNPDVLLVQPTFEPLISLMQSGQADIAAPLVVDTRGRVQDSFRGLPSPWEILWRRVQGASLAGDLPSGEILRADWLAGIFLVMKAQTFSRLGGFDPRFHLYFEDVDLCTRARLSGLAIAVNARVRVQHNARRYSRRRSRYLLWHLQSAWRFFGSDVYRRARRLSARHG